ncbi:GNAT family N-acetyltransferase [Psychrobacter sp. FDAARGOS_221]|uniref:GNAT family N-acetyltransferase n=1 Tax=Psychrobacter sp. FDAARGOS_221 TaxID=1975705 RepID=UPI000BB553A5|nr:GNAT family N-acetyltransferase [Psychrobacter sp. FDAARGOS_221]PNK61183.1 GNAT family N-acetyltransferase [Psychrobacter sp. FDAARGOS_221]
MSRSDLFLRQATAEDAEAIVELLNLTFRSDVGWTNESSLVGGIRTTVAEIKSILADPNNYFFVYPELKAENEETGKILASISVTFKRESNSAYIGLFAVDPSLQGQGIGHRVLEAAETFATRHLGTDSDKVRLTMSILSQRPDLQAYYERRGYQLSGNSQPFPVDSNNGEPKVADLRLLEMVKLAE